MLKKIKKYHALPKEERKLIAHCLLWLMYSYLLVRFIPLKCFVNVLGEHQKEAQSILNPEELAYLIRLQKNMRRLKRNLPWNVKCFEEVIAAKKLLKKKAIKSTLYLGVARNEENKLIAHAWLKTDNRIVFGQNRQQKFTSVAHYA